MNLPEPPAAPSRAPANGLKVMLTTVGFFALTAIYGQWQHLQRAKVIHATLRPLPNESTVSHNEH